MKDETRESIRQWRAKADSDWTTVQILLRNEQCPRDAVSFHCQQFVEKLLKALLTRHGVEAPRTHDIRRLIQLAAPFAPGLSRFTDASDALTVHRVETRYPGDWHEIEPTEMDEVVELAKELGELLRSRLDQ